MGSFFPKIRLFLSSTGRTFTFCNRCDCKLKLKMSGIKNKEDVKDILASDLLKGADDEKIETFIANNLSQYDNLL